jgi:uncharacterized surface protein with fasciclin (FAS1) repeats
MSPGKIRWAVVALVLVLAGGPGPRAAEPEKDLVATAKAAGKFKTLLTAATEAGLVDTLKGGGPFTLFAPTDEAFAKIPEQSLNALLQDKAKLKEVLLYHVIKGDVMAADAVKLGSTKTALGQSILIRASGGKVMINDAQVTQADIKASNGVIHVIDTVLLPPAR